MKSSNKLVLHKSLLFLLVMAVLLMSVSSSYAQESDQGWSAPVNLSLSGAASNPVTVVDSGGRIHAIWLDAVDGYRYSQSRDDGKTWSEPQTVKFPFGPKDPPPVLLPGPNGSIHVFWMSSGNSSGDQNSSSQGASLKRLSYAQATSGDLAYPQNWILNSPLSNDVASYDVVADTQGGLHVAFIRGKLEDDNPVGVYYTQSPSAGGYWIEPRLLYQSDYFRTAKQDDLYVRVSTSNVSSGQKVFVTWDNRAQKRVFMAVSKDTGLEWNDAQQIKGPEDTGGIDTPFNLTVASFGENVLLIWQVGEPGSSQCIIYSQWSEDSGVSWKDPLDVFGGRSECPISIKVVKRDSNYISVMFVGQVSPILVAWNGSQWSDIQTQAQLPSFANPLTFDIILLGCRFDLFIDDHLYVAGCDQGSGGDVWFLSRLLEPVDTWFSPSTLWSEPDSLSVTSKDPTHISNFYSTPDMEGNIHAMWVQSPVGEGNQSGIEIEYAHWDGQQWSNPESVIKSIEGMPIQLMVTADSLDRLLLTWIDGYNGDLVFSWANAERANLSSEWVEVTGLPVPSRLANASDLVVDDNGRIVSAFAIPVNEERGIYITQSADGGKSWSLPVRVFDAVTEGWESVGQPRISLGNDGTLHLIFIRDTIREGQSVGLYYTRSVDGGATWSAAQALSEGEIQWADVVSYGDHTVHVIWQEYDGLVYANVSQVSQDGGITWGKQNGVTGVNEGPTRVSVAGDGRGLLHFMQLITQSNAETQNQEEFLLQDWKWDGSVWNIDVTKEFVIKGEEVGYSLSTGITSTGFLGVFVPVEYTQTTGELKSEVLTFGRYLEGIADGPALQARILPVSTFEVGEENSSVSEPTPTPDFSILYDDNVSTSPLQKNAVGLILIGVGVVATFILLLWRRRPTNID